MMLDERDNEIAFLQKLLRDSELTTQAERKASALYLAAAVVFGAAFVILLLVVLLGWG